MIKYAFREMTRRKGRAGAAIGSFALAVVIFVVLLSLQRTTNRSLYQTLTGTGTHFIAFRPVCCNLPMLRDESHEGFWANGSRSGTMPVALIDSIRALHTIADASPLLMFRFRDSIAGTGYTVAGFVVGPSAAVFNTTCAETDVTEGRFLDPSDTDAVLLEQSFAASHAFAAGKTILLQNRLFQIAGIVNAGIRPVKADVYMPYRDAERLISVRTWNPVHDEMNIVLVESGGAEVHGRAIQDVRRVLGRENLVSSYSCSTPAAAAIGLHRKTLRMLTVLLIGYVILHVFRNQYASLVERRRELGILFSLGWTRARVVTMLVVEFGLQAAAGAIIGGWIGLLLDIMTASHARVRVCASQPCTDSVILVLYGIGTILTTAVFSGCCAAWFSTKKEPAANLRSV